MKRKKLSIKFYLNTYKPHKDGYKIYMRVIYDQKKFEVATDYYSIQEEWDKQTGRAKGSMSDQINKYLSEQEHKVYKAKERLEYEGKEVSSAAIKEVLFGKIEFDNRLLDYFAEHIEQIEQMKNDYSESTVKTYRTSIKHLRKFLQMRNQLGISLKKVDYNFISAYDLYLRSQVRTRRMKLLDNNTVVKQHSKLRTIMLKAVKEGYVPKSPYLNFKLSIKERKVVALSKNDLQVLEDIKLPERLDRVWILI